MRGYPLSQQETRVPCSLISARSGVQQAARAYSLIWSGLFACRGGVGGRVGSGFDKFLYNHPEFDGTWQDPARLPHSRLGQKMRGISHYGSTWHCAASHTLLILRLSHNPKRDDEVRGYLRSQQERRRPCSLTSARSGVQLAARAHSPIWSGLFACRGVVGGRVGSGFDKFMYDRPELDGTWKDPARLPHSWLDQRIARHLHSQKDLALRGIPILGRSSLLPIFVALCGRFSLP